MPERKGVLTSAVRRQLGSGRDTGIHVSGTGKTANTACINEAMDVAGTTGQKKAGSHQHEGGKGHWGRGALTRGGSQAREGAWVLGEAV